MYTIFVVNNKRKYEKVSEKNFILISPNENKDGSLFCEIQVFEDSQIIAKVFGLVCFYHAGKKLDLFQFLDHQEDKVQKSFFRILYFIYYFRKYGGI